MRIKLKGINSRRKRLADGRFKTYYWAWKSGPPLQGEPGTPEFVASYNAAVAQKVAPPTGVLLTLLFRFQESGEFQHSISPRTRRDYIKQIKRIEKTFGDFPIKAMAAPGTRAIFLKWRDELAQTSLRQADYAYGTLARILSWAHNRRLITENPCAKGGKLYHGTRVDKIWDDEQVARFLKPLRPIYGWRCCSQSTPDSGRAICCACRGVPTTAKTIKLRQKKTGAYVPIPVADAAEGCARRSTDGEARSCSRTAMASRGAKADSKARGARQRCGREFAG